VQLPYYYVQDAPPPAPAHHWDYRLDRADQALCGHSYDEPLYQGHDRPKDVCDRCEKLLPAWLTDLWEQWADEHEHADAAVDQKAERQIRGLQNELASAYEKIKQLQDDAWSRAHKGKRVKGVRTPRVSIVSGGLPGHGKKR